MGYVEPDLAAPGTVLEARIGGRLWPAVVTEDSPYDPENARLRADG
jgi:dimethylglycine dehydrogenase